MNCQRLDRGSTWLDFGHRLRCPECRAAVSVDAIIARGVAQLRAEKARPEGLARTLAGLGLGATHDTLPRAATQRMREPEPMRRLVVGIGLGVVGILMILILSAHSRAVALAETAAALRQVSSIHWRGVWVFRGEQQHWEVWKSSGRFREDKGNSTTIDDGQKRLRHKRGAAVVFLASSHAGATRRLARGFQPGGYLPEIEELVRRPGWFGRVERQVDRTPEGRPVQRFEIYRSMDRRGHATHDQRSRLVLFVDPATKLPIRWVNYELRGGQWHVSSRVDHIEYNIAFSPDVYRLALPDGTRTVDIDTSRRERGRLMAQRAPNGREVVLRTVELTTEGDVLVSISQIAGSDRRTPPAPIFDGQIVDDRGRVYALAPHTAIERVYSLHWFVPLTPWSPHDPLPRRLTLSAELANAGKVTFRDIPAPPPAFESVLEVPPYHDTVMSAHDVEETRAQARAQHHRVRR